MGLITKIFPPKEVKAAIGILDEINLKFNNKGFKMVRNYIEKAIFSNPKKFVEIMQSENESPREWIYMKIANIAGDLVESGQYHIYRGILNPQGPGSHLLQLYDMAVDEIVKMGKLDIEKAKQEKKALRKNIENVG